MANNPKFGPEKAIHSIKILSCRDLCTFEVRVANNNAAAASA